MVYSLQEFRENVGNVKVITQVCEFLRFRSTSKEMLRSFSVFVLVQLTLNNSLDFRLATIRAAFEEHDDIKHFSEAPAGSGGFYDPLRLFLM